MQSKEYKLPNGKTAVFEYDVCGIGKITLECMDELMGMIADIVRCKECRHWCCHNDVDYDQSKFTYYCEVHGISLEGDEFCSFGEREGE